MLVLGAARGGEHNPERVVLTGKTALGASMELVLYDGRLQSFASRAAAWCADHGTWERWDWHPTDGHPAVRFNQEGRHFRVREPWRSDTDASARFVAVLDGRVDEDTRAAAGTIRTRVVWGRKAVRRCAATVRFSARRTP